MRILLPSIVDPALSGGGAWTVTRELVRMLKEGPLAAEVEVVALPRYAGRRRRVRQARAIAASLLSPRPAKIQFAFDRHLRARTRVALASRPFDLALINGTDLLWLLSELPPALPRALVAHNIESQLFSAQVSSTGLAVRPFSRWANRECARLRTYELEGLRRAGGVIFLSSADEAHAAAHAPSLRRITIPPVFSDPPAPRSVAPMRTPGRVELGMLANFDWWPNPDGLDWFLRNVFPGAPKGTRLHLFGRGSDSVAPPHPRIVGHGFTRELTDVWTTCDFMICPIRSGSGVCVKVAESLYHGVPTLATSKAVRGLPIEARRAPGVAVLDNPDEWIQFLHQEAQQFANEIVPSTVSERFHPAAYAEALAVFLSPPGDLHAT